MPLAQSDRDTVHSYCVRDIPHDIQWYVDLFSFLGDSELEKRLGRAFYSARYIYKLGEALAASGDELHSFVKFQIAQYAAIYEAVITRLLWGRYKDHVEVKKLETHKSYKRVSALGSLTSMTYDGVPLFPCVYADSKTPRNSIPFRDKVDCAVRVGFIDAVYAEEIKRTYELRNLAHIETEAAKQIEVEIENAKSGYWRLQPFIERVVETIRNEDK